MKESYILKQVREGRITADQLCVLTPILAKQKDPESPLLLDFIDRRRLWKRWGFENLSDYVRRTGIPAIVVQCSTALMLADPAAGTILSGDRNGKARRMVEQLFVDNPVSMSGDEFMRRMLQICDELDKGASEGRGAA